MKSQYVQYGCAACAPTGWRNFDSSPTLRLQRLPVVSRYFKGGAQFPTIFPKNVEYGDIVKGLPVAAGSCRAVYCSHVLEHLSLQDFRTALKNTCSYLEKDGIFRLVLPDLEYLARTYLDSDAADAALVFMEKSYLGKKTRPTGFKGLVREQLGNSNHLWMWDYKAMASELEQAGFRNIRRAAFGDSAEPKFQAVEDVKRWTNCLGVECVR
jgi:hypothetical protein